MICASCERVLPDGETVCEDCSSELEGKPRCPRYQRVTPRRQIEYKKKRSSASTLSNLDNPEIFLVFCSLLMIFGAFGPWVKVLNNVSDGMSEGGVVVLLCAIGVGFAIHYRVTSVALVACFGISLAVALYKWCQINSVQNLTNINLGNIGAGNGTLQFVDMQWGLMVVIAASICGLIVATAMLFKQISAD